MTTMKKILVMWMLTLMIEQSMLCSFTFHVKAMNRRRQAEAERKELLKLKEEMAEVERKEKEQYELYKEERRLRLKELEKLKYFQEKQEALNDINITEFTEFLLEDYDYGLS